MTRNLCIGALALASFAGLASAQDGLIVGFDDTTQGATVAWIRQGSNWNPLFEYTTATGNVDVWGLAGDPATCTLYISNGFELFTLRPGESSPTRVADFTFDGVNRSVVGLAWLNGRLIGYSGVTDEGFYEIDTTTAVATRVWTGTEGGFLTAWDFGGIDSDGTTLYGFTDAGPTGEPRGLYRIDLTARTLTLVRANFLFPGNTTNLTAPDVDGLAVGNGRAFLVIDNPGDIPVLELPGGASLPETITAPFPTSEIFSGGAYLPCFLSPPACRPDLNADGELTFDDIQLFVQLYNANDARADFNNDQEWTFDDIQLFIQLFNAGC